MKIFFENLKNSKLIICCLKTESNFQKLAGPSRASSGPGAIKSTGNRVGVAAQGQEGATANANQFKTLIWFSIMQSSNCSMLMYISAHNIVKVTSKRVIIYWHFTISILCNYRLNYVLKSALFSDKKNSDTIAF